MKFVRSDQGAKHVTMPPMDKLFPPKKKQRAIGTDRAEKACEKAPKRFWPPM